MRKSSVKSLMSKKVNSTFIAGQRIISEHAGSNSSDILWMSLRLS